MNAPFKSLLVAGLMISATTATPVLAQDPAFLPEIYQAKAAPDDDKTNYQDFFRKKFPDIPWDDFGNGMYAVDSVIRENWEQIEEFPPYDPTIEEGEALWQTPFANGKSYADCFPEPGVVNEYPKWDRQLGTVVTVEMAINQCREAHGEAALKYGKSDMLAVHAYMAYASRGKPINVVVPPDDPAALEAYNSGKHFYFARRGQLNLSCYHCHFDTAGSKIRANVLSPALGQTSHWPTYRSKWGGMGGIHRRYTGCNKQVRAKPFAQQSEEYRNLEYFHTHLSNGIPVNGPGARF